MMKHVSKNQRVLLQEAGRDTCKGDGSTNMSCRILGGRSFSTWSLVLRSTKGLICTHAQRHQVSHCKAPPPGMPWLIGRHATLCLRPLGFTCLCRDSRDSSAVSASREPRLEARAACSALPCAACRTPPPTVSPHAVLSDRQGTNLRRSTAQLSFMGHLLT